MADQHEGDRVAAALGDKAIMVMGGHGVTVCGPTVADAFDELFIAERTCMYQMTAMATGLPLRRLPERVRRGWTGHWGEKIDARLHVDAWRRVLDKEGSRLRHLKLVSETRRMRLSACPIPTEFEA